MSTNKGIKYDNGKPAWHLVPPGMFSKVVEVFTFGAHKYAPDNWKLLDEAEDRTYSAAMRHLDKMRDGEWLDEETGLPHAAHAITEIIFWWWHHDNKEKKDVRSTARSSRRGGISRRRKSSRNQSDT